MHKQITLYPKNKVPLPEVRRFIVIFYLVGVTGFLIPHSREIFIHITPLALLMSAYLLAVYHTSYNRRAVIAFGLVFLFSYGVEVAGVKTHSIFGRYTYGETLGIKVFETPLLIGVNWLFLSYASASVTGSRHLHPFVSLLLAPVLMLIYDLVLEQVAPAMDMWDWHHASVPVRNYIAWYVTGFVCVALLKAGRVETKNPVAATLLLCQFVFFFVLSFLL